MCPIMVVELLVPSHIFCQVSKQSIILACPHLPLISVVMVSIFVMTCDTLSPLSDVTLNSKI